MKTGLSSIAQNLIHRFTDLFFPETCLVCSKPPHKLHRKCMRALPYSRTGVPHHPWIFPTLNYCDERTQQLVRYLKNTSDTIQMNICGKFMCSYHYETILELIQFYPNTPINIISIPSNKSRKKKYDFNQSELLAKSFSQYIPESRFFPETLYRSRDTKKQAFCTREERLLNMDHVFKVRANHQSVVHESICILIDDVVTTGATLADAKRALMETGAQKLVAITLAH